MPWKVKKSNGKEPFKFLRKVSDINQGTRPMRRMRTRAEEERVNRKGRKNAK